MKFQSPSLVELHAFLTVCELGSFRRAADKLCVTQAAVSRAVARLEQQLDCRLFDRSATGVTVTTRGQQFQNAMGVHVAGLEAGMSSWHRKPKSRTLRLSVVPTLGSRWLVPRLTAMQIAHPDLNIELRQFHYDDDFTRDDVDIWIEVKRPGRPWPRGMRAQYLLGKEVLPVCSPKVFKQLGNYAQFDAKDLTQLPLLYHTNFPNNWSLWMQNMGVNPANLELGAGFDLGNNLIIAACADMGVAVIQPCLIESELASGKLIIPYPKSVSTERGYYVCYRPASSNLDAIIAFSKWVQVQAVETESRLTFILGKR